MLAMVEPGIDRHEWESEWLELEEQLVDSPGKTLAEVEELVGRMLEARGFTVHDPWVAEGRGTRGRRRVPGRT
jgi:hypothetical protein